MCRHTWTSKLTGYPFFPAAWGECPGASASSPPCPGWCWGGAATRVAASDAVIHLQQKRTFTVCLMQCTHCIFLNNFFVVVQKACSLNKKPKEREYFRIFLLLIRPRQVSTSFARDSSCLRFLDYYRLRRWIVKMSTYFKHLEYGMSPERLHPWYTSSDERGFLFIQGCIQLCLNRRNCSWANDSNPIIMHPYLC